MTSFGLGSPAQTTAALGLVGRVLSERYRIEALLGEGGMGAVYLAEHVLMRKRLAVKVLHPEMTRVPEIVARFEREAMAAAHIEHPNVAAATDFGKLEDGSFFLVLEYVEGTSLRDLVATGPLGVERSMHIAYQVASGLGRAHALGIVHRDLKPENVMLVDRDGDPDFVKVLDFGIAKVPVGELSTPSPAGSSGASSGQVLTQLGMVYGTPEYMAPEQALGQEVDARADLYALGVLLFEMITGSRPFEADSKVALLGMKVTSHPPTLVSKNPTVRVTDEVEAVVRRLLDKEAATRFQDANSVLEAIEACRMGVARTEPPEVRVNPAPLNVPSSRGYRASLASVPRGPGSSGDLRRSLADARGSLADARAHVHGQGQSTADDEAKTTAIKVTTGGRPPATVRPPQGNPVARLVGFARAVPPLFLGLGLGAVVLIVVVVALVRGPSDAGALGAASSGASASASVPIIKRLLEPQVASSEDLATAVSGGVVALEALSQRFSQDPAVWRALLRAYTKEKRPAEAMRAVAKLTALSDKEKDESDVAAAVTAAALASGESSDAAFALMESGLGSKGPDLLYDLSTAKGVPPRVQARVKQTLAKADVKGRMSPALSVALDLRAASGCEAKRALLPRAKESGDGRALPSLRPLQVSKGCGFLALGDCWSCLHKDGSLGAAISAIEERSAK